MKNEISKYIEYSLFVHNYLIIPGLGGFIVNMEHARPGLNIEPPKFRIVFNPELSHDDGILVSYIVKDEKVSYNAASLMVKNFVKDVKNDLKNGKSVTFSWGCFALDDRGNMSFSENQSTVHPDFFGLTSISLKYLTDIKNESHKETKRVLLRNTLGAVAAATAALFLFAIPSAHISDKGDSQQAGFVHTLVQSFPVKSETEVAPKAEESIPEKKVSGRTYYVVVGGEESKSGADYLLKKIRSAGFSNANIVESTDRYRIYVASFADKTECESFLETFRRENPKYETAWLYSKRN